MKLMYLDESGDHALDKIDPQYPIFVLGGIIIDAIDRRHIDRSLQQFKRRFFTKDDVILHTADIVRAKNDFEILRDPEVRSAFLQELSELMQLLNYKVVACVIKKDEHLNKYGAKAIDPYALSLRVLVERFCQEIGDIQDGGLIFAEKRGHDLDVAMERAWMDILKNGTLFKTGGTINKRILDLSMKDKRLNIGGLQLADLVVSPIGRAVIGKTPHGDWRIVESKFRQGPGGHQGHGLIILPREK